MVLVFDSHVGHLRSTAARGNMHLEMTGSTTTSNGTGTTVVPLLEQGPGTPDSTTGSVSSVFSSKPANRKLAFINAMRRNKPLKKTKSKTQAETDFLHDLDDFTDFFDTENDKDFFIAAAKGRLAEFEKLYFEDTKRISLVDSKGRTALHHASKHGHIPIMEFIFQHGGNLNATDEAGDTALHVAVEANQPAAVDHLLGVGADANLRNTKEILPLHRAVELNRPELITVMVKHKSVDLDAPGNKGSTALHYAAYNDSAECAKILLEKGAKMCKPCDIGLMPIHVAARNASTKTLNVLLDHAEKLGCTNRSELLKVQDNSANTPLHSAVNGGDIKAVRTCIEAGASITDQLDDKSTAVHIACAQGNLEMLKLMYEMQNSAFNECLNMQDIMGMTPLHRAALFDRVDVVRYLTEQGADVEMMDSEGRTVILVAASRKAWPTVNLLLEMNASTQVRDNRNRNILHLIIRNGGNPANLRFSYFESDFKELLNHQDEYGCTPLHYASREGQLCTIEQLIKLGAILNTKNNKRESPLHFAARFGRYNTCRRFLDSPGGTLTINDMDSSGKTPLHLAASEGHIKVTQLLLQRGATILRDQRGNTPLHLAAANGYIATMRAILTVHSYLLNAENKKGDTPLHMASREGHAAGVTLLLSMGAELKKNKEEMHFFDLAVKHEHKEACIAVVTHDRWKECLYYPSKLYGCPMIGLIRHLPDVCQMVLDRCRQASNHDTKSKDFHYTYDFTFLQMPMEKILQLRKQNEDYMPLFALNNMVRFNRVECLSHPVCVTFLQMKWRAYGMWVHMFNLIIYMTFLTALTVFVASYDIAGPLQDATSDNGTEAKRAWSKGKGSYYELNYIQRISTITVMTFCILNVIKEVGQMVQQKMKYLFDLSNLVEWILYLTSGMFIGPFLAGMAYDWQWQCGAIAVFLAWFNFLLFLQRFDFYGIYVVMFLEILKTLLQALFVFSILIIAFGLSFYIVLCQEETHAYRQPLLSLMTVSVMMTGNIEYIATWVEPLHDGNLYFPAVSYIMLAIFIVLMPILVMNLLIGLAVGDIEAVLKNARLKRLAMQVELHTDLERKLPGRVLKYVDRSTWNVYSNRSEYLFKKVWNKMTTTHGISMDTSRENSVPDEDASSESYIYQELYNQNKRIKSIGGQLDKTYDLLRLVVKKMDITMESEDFDDCETPEFHLPAVKDTASGKRVTWSSPAIRHTLLKQASTLAHWHNLDP